MPGTPFSVLCRLNRTLKKKRNKTRLGAFLAYFIVGYRASK